MTGCRFYRIIRPTNVLSSDTFPSRLRPLLAGFYGFQIIKMVPPQPLLESRPGSRSLIDEFPLNSAKQHFRSSESKSLGECVIIFSLPQSLAQRRQKALHGMAVDSLPRKAGWLLAG